MGPKRISTLAAVLAALACSCAEPPDPEQVILKPMPDDIGMKDGKHFLADKPLKTFDQTHSDRWKSLEAIGHARKRQQEYRDKHSAVVDPTSPDPLRGAPLPLPRALAGVEGQGPLRAELVTTAGTVRCELLEGEQAVGVAHFAGLARGNRPWWDAAGGAWRREPFYRDLPVYKIMPGVAFYSGCPMAVGYAEVGFRTTPGSREDARVKAAPYTLGVLISKVTGTMGPQFVVTGGKETELRTPFVPVGRCQPSADLERILQEPVAEEGLPMEDLVLMRVDVARGAPGAGADGHQ
jgi:cyclophilin family peptidyl-prolyl cis-trans isomerase